MPEATPTWRVAIVSSRYNASITDRLLQAALDTFADQCAGEAEVVHAPGVFELPALAAAAAKTGRFDGILALGCVIKGETSHDRHIAGAVANALASMPAQLGLPVAFGVLTVDTVEQARARAGGAKGNKGREAMEALLETLASIAALQAGTQPTIGAPRPDKAGTPS